MDFLQKSMAMFYAPYQHYYDMEWPMQQAKMIHRFRVVRDPPIKDPDDDKEIKWLLVCEQFHGRWSDTSLIHALVDLEQAFGLNIIQYGGRDKGNRTWVKFFEADNRQFEGRGNLIFVLWLHEDCDATPVDGFFYQVGQQLRHQDTPPEMSFTPQEEVIFQDAELTDWATEALASGGALGGD